MCECEQPYSDYRDGQISPAMAAQREPYLPVLYPWRRERDRETERERERDREREREREKETERERQRERKRQRERDREREVNLDKTRVMVFQKKARSQGSRYQFSYGGEVLEHSTSYSYLGIQISASGGLQSGCEGFG